MNELVYSHQFRKMLQAERQSNQTLLLAARSLPDRSDLVIEDTTGHRYARNIRLEQYLGANYWIFEII